MRTSALPFAAVAALSCVALLTPSSAHAEDVDLQKCPVPVIKALQAAGKIGKVDKEMSKDGTFYAADGTSETGAFQILLSADGKIVHKSEEVKMASCPPAVKLAIVGKTNGKTVNGIEKITDEGKVSFVVDSRDKDGLEYQVEFSAEGKLLGQDEVLTPENTPPAIQKAINAKVVPGGKVTEVHKLTDAEGKISYSARIVSSIMNLELDAEGKVLGFTKVEE